MIKKGFNETTGQRYTSLSFEEQGGCVIRWISVEEDSVFLSTHIDNIFLWRKDYPRFLEVADEVLLDVELFVLDDGYELRWNSLGFTLNKNDIKPRWRAEDMFFLTRDGAIEITTIKQLFQVANQCYYEHYTIETSDKFGRNCTDKAFIRLCNLIHFYVPSEEPFKLSCKKVGGKHMATLQVRDEFLEMDVVEMIHHFERYFGKQMDEQLPEPQLTVEKLNEIFGKNCL